MISFLTEWLLEIWSVLVDSGPYLLIGFFIAGLIKVFVPESWIYRHLGKDNLKSVGVASMAGVPIPLCSCSVIPTAISLKKSGASKGATTSFLISTPETGVDSIGITWALMDPIMTIMRPLSALLTALGCGTIVNFLVKRGWAGEAPADVEEEAQASCCARKESATKESDSKEGSEDKAEDANDHSHDGPHGHSHTHAEDEPGIGKLRRASRYAFGTLLDDLTPWFVFGFVISGLIMVLLPDDFFGRVMPTGLTSMLTMLVVGVPMYICATASTPVAAALLAKGLDPGAALVLLLAGPATNVATIAVVSNFLGRRVLYVYLGGIAVFSLMIGFFVNWLYSSFGIDSSAIIAKDAELTRSWIDIAGGVVLSLLVLRSALRINLLARFGKQLRKMSAPLGFDPTSALGKGAGILALLCLWASTAFTSLEAGEAGFRLRFGSIQEAYEEPGLILHAPYPFESVTKIRTDLVRTLDFGFVRNAEDARRSALSPREIANEAELMCGDETVLKITYSLHYSISDARRYIFGIGDPEDLLKGLAANALRRVTAKLPADEILVEKRGTLEGAMLRELRAELALVNVGVQAVAIDFLEVHAPPAVHEAFRDVASAIEDKERKLREAHQYANERETRVRGTTFRLDQEAQQDAHSALQETRGRVNAFEAVRLADAEAPSINRMRLRLESAGRSWKNSRLVLVLGEGITIELWRTEGDDMSLPDVFGGTTR